MIWSWVNSSVRHPNLTTELIDPSLDRVGIASVERRLNCNLRWNLLFGGCKPNSPSSTFQHLYGRKAEWWGVRKGRLQSTESSWWCDEQCVGVSCCVAWKFQSTAIVRSLYSNPSVIKGGIHKCKVSMSRNDLPYSISDTRRSSQQRRYLNTTGDNHRLRDNTRVLMQNSYRSRMNEWNGNGIN